ncbi:MAG TPA: YheU family protein [Candidatus Dormibacteraeota bacterium]|nr:YheU family protein [Candidatus Dormibacteraeota bacterium]
MDDEQSEPIDVPLDALSPTALRGLVEEFVNREGTDYGLRERTLDEKVRDVMRQLERREAKIVFDPETRSATIVVVRRRSS